MFKLFYLYLNKKRVMNECSCGQTSNNEGICDGFGEYICKE
jgi:hypothetical protein